MTASSSPRIIITGASGYLGRHLVKALRASGKPVLEVVRKAPLNARPSREFVCADLSDPDYLLGVLAPDDTVIHLACLPLNPSEADPQLSFSTNVGGTFNLLNSCRRAGVNRVVFASTSAVYGNGKGGAWPWPETHYGGAKLAAEAVVAEHSRHFTNGSIILRIFNVFGPDYDGKDRMTVDEIFLSAVKAGRELYIAGHRDEARDFVFVGDVVQALAGAAGSMVTGTFDIGSGMATSLWDLALAAGAHPSQIRWDEGSSSPKASVLADIEPARNALMFEPSVNILDDVRLRLAGLR